MKKAQLASAAAVLAAGALIGLGNAGVALGSANDAPHSIVTVYNGPSVSNTHSAPATAAFTSWCASVCAPSVTMPAVDASTGKALGTIYVWTKNLDLSGGPIRFGEFIWFALNDGDIYVNSGDSGTVGALMDPATVKAPTHLGSDPGAVAGGGGDGTIVGGTRKYSKWTGTYTDRVFVELNFAGGANYYDQLFFSVNPD